jgi:hypothetical protein
MYNLAHYNETILGNESIILSANYDGAWEKYPDASEKFKKRFQVFEHGLSEQPGGPFNLYYSNVDEVDKIIKEQGVDALYIIKGCSTPFMSRVVPNLIHYLFLSNSSHYDGDPSRGDKFAFISDWLALQCKQTFNLDHASVPWMVDIADPGSDLREELGIPSDALVLGYHGGHDCFSLPWVGGPIRQVLNSRQDLHIIMMNVDRTLTPIDFDHPRLKFLPGTADMDRKAKFIKTCDAMLHARNCGETFGSSCAEFSLLNRPIIGCRDVPDRCHIDILGEKFIGYSNPQELYDILTTISKDFIAGQNWDCYSEKYSPEPVMKKFKEIFLDGLSK